jgi:hypothetical protein
MADTHPITSTSPSGVLWTSLDKLAQRVHLVTFAPRATSAFKFPILRTNIENGFPEVLRPRYGEAWGP